NYNFWAAIRHRVTGGGRSDLEPGEGEAFFCSQLVLEAYRQAGQPLTTTPPDWNSPQNIAELALARRLDYVGHLTAEVSAPEPAYGSGHGRGNGYGRAFGGDPVAQARQTDPRAGALLERLRQRGYTDAQLAPVASELRARPLAHAARYARPLGSE